MVSVNFTDEQNTLRQLVREFLESEILPTVEYYDKTEQFPISNIEKIAKQQLMGINIPREYGGAGYSEIEYGILIEEFGRICSAHGTIVGAHLGLACTPIRLFGTEDQKLKYLPSMSRGEKLGAFALTEPAAGSDAANIRTTAEKSGDEFILNGNKIFCTNGDKADVIIVFAANNRALGPAGGITAFIVEKGFAGFSIGKVERKMGIRASTTAELVFENCRVPKENTLGQLGAGFRVALITLDGGRIGLAAGALGAAEKTLETTISFVRQEAFGSSLAEKQSVQWMIADSAMEIHAARLVVYNSLLELDKYFKIIAKGEKVPKDFRERISRNSAIAKTYVSEIASKIIDKAMDIHGELGLVEGYGLERAYRDSFIAEIYEGTNEIQRMVIARDILGISGP
ncbi:MAG: acyl-CoA dehydrogenase [Thaumarchaeota archaeon]|nr:acyl-CoA dehydrogenase [Nitrososphaerota archaeon]